MATEEKKVSGQEPAQSEIDKKDGVLEPPVEKSESPPVTPTKVIENEKLAKEKAKQEKIKKRSTQVDRLKARSDEVAPNGSIARSVAAKLASFFKKLAAFRIGKTIIGYIAELAGLFHSAKAYTEEAQKLAHEDRIKERAEAIKKANEYVQSLSGEKSPSKTEKEVDETLPIPQKQEKPFNERKFKEFLAETVGKDVFAGEKIWVTADKKDPSIVVVSVTHHAKDNDTPKKETVRIDKNTLNIVGTKTDMAILVMAGYYKFAINEMNKPLVTEPHVIADYINKAAEALEKNPDSRVDIERDNVTFSMKKNEDGTYGVETSLRYAEDNVVTITSIKSMTKEELLKDENTKFIASNFDNLVIAFIKEFNDREHIYGHRENIPFDSNPVTTPREAAETSRLEECLKTSIEEVKGDSKKIAEFSNDSSVYKVANLENGMFKISCITPVKTGNETTMHLNEASFKEDQIFTPRSLEKIEEMKVVEHDVRDAENREETPRDNNANKDARDFNEDVERDIHLDELIEEDYRQDAEDDRNDNNEINVLDEEELE